MTICLLTTRPLLRCSAPSRRRFAPKGFCSTENSYMTPAIYHVISDLTGGLLAFARLAAETDADVIVLVGAFPEAGFVRPCTLCLYMERSITRLR